MKDDLLPHLLSDADRQMPMPDVAHDLENRITHRLQRRKIVRRSGMVAIIVLATFPFILMRTGPKPVQSAKAQPTTNPVTLADPKPDQWDALVHEETANAILRLRRERSGENQTLSTGRTNAEIERLEAAAVLLAAGDHFANQGNSPQQAKDAYQRVIANFPGTPCAVAASQRLAGQSF